MMQPDGRQDVIHSNHSATTSSACSLPSNPSSSYPAPSVVTQSLCNQQLVGNLSIRSLLEEASFDPGPTLPLMFIHSMILTCLQYKKEQSSSNKNGDQLISLTARWEWVVVRSLPLHYTGSMHTTYIQCGCQQRPPRWHNKNTHPTPHRSFTRMTSPPTGTR